MSVMHIFVSQVTIIPRGESGGHTSFLQEKDASFWTRAQLIAQLDVLMGGRVGEEVAFGFDNVTIGASDDFKVKHILCIQCCRFQSILIVSEFKDDSLYIRAR